MDMLRESQDEASSRASKKPHVPKVAEIMPGSVIKKPKPIILAQSVKQTKVIKPILNKSPPRKQQQQSTVKKYINSPPKKPESKKFLPTTPSVSNISQPPIAAPKPPAVKSYRATTPPKKNF